MTSTGHNLPAPSQGKERNEQGPGEDIVIAGYTYNDQKDMRRLGKKQEFRRNFRIISTVAFTSCVMGTWEILLTANTQGLTAGGLAGIFWSLVWCYAGQLFVILSLAEMSAMAPTSGGQYHWTSELAPRSCQRILSYFSGWLSIVSWESIIAVDCFLVGTIIQELISLNNSSYSPQRWQGTLLTWGVAIAASLFNILGAKQLPLAENIFATLHVVAFIPIIVCLWVLTPVKQSAKAVFTEFTDNGSGWPNRAWGVMVGQVSTMFVVLGSDSVAHMAEEIENAGVTVPRAMVWSFLLNVPFTFILLITFLFCIGDLKSALDPSIGFPFIYVFQNATGSNSSTTGLTVILLVLLFMITISSLASTSRQTFAFARDNGLPFSKWLGTVDKQFQVPVNAIIFTCTFTIIISLINVGSTVAFNAFLSLSTTALMGTYVISIGCVTLKRLRKQPLPSTRWSLGRAGMPVNCIALVYACWSFFWSFWPNEYQPSITSFNWASVLFAGLMIIAGLLYLVRAKHFYDGPVAKVIPMEGVNNEVEY